MDDKGFVWNNNALEALFELGQNYQPVFRGGRKNSIQSQDIMEEVEKKKLAVMEKMAEDSATFQNSIIEFLQYRENN